MKHPKIKKIYLLSASVLTLVLVNCSQLTSTSKKNSDKLKSPSDSAGSVLAINDKNFNQKISTSPSKLIIIDFWATWCAPCVKQAKILQKMAQKKLPYVRFYKIDIDQNPKMTAQYEIEAIPALIFFKDGKVVHRQVGLTDRKSLTDLINRYSKN